MHRIESREFCSRFNFISGRFEVINVIISPGVTIKLRENTQTKAKVQKNETIERGSKMRPK